MKRFVIPAIVVVGALLITWIIHPSLLSPLFGHQKPGVVTVDSDGGTYKLLDGLVVHVPKGAVDHSTTLTMTPPRLLTSADTGPQQDHRTAGVVFDLSLSRGKQHDIQPKLSLGYKLPVAGRFLPPGADPKQALVYTSTGDPRIQYGNVLNGVNAQNVASGEFPHLSPKYVVFLDGDAFSKTFGIKDKELTSSEKCKQEISLGDKSKVKIGGQTRGWSLKKGSPIFACLTAGKDGGAPVLGIANRLNYILSVASSGGIEMKSSSGDADEEMVKYFAKAVFGNKAIKTFVGEGGKLVANMPPSKLPALIQLATDPNTYLSELGLFAVNFLVTLEFGQSVAELRDTVKKVLESVDVVSCLKQALDISTAEASDFSFGDGLKLVSSKCAETIGKAVVPSPGMWDIFGKVYNTVSQGVSGGWNLTLTAIDGVKGQFGDRITVEVTYVPPPVPECPSESMIKSALGGGAMKFYMPVVCQSGWAAAGVQFIGGANSTVVLHRYSTGWKIVANDTDMGAKVVDGKRLCLVLPEHVLEHVFCPNDEG
jgi:hypothetical protein